MRYHKYRYNYDKWVKQTGWNPFAHEKRGQKYYDILPSLYYTNQTLERFKNVGWALQLQK